MTAATPAASAGGRAVSARFMLRHPAHVIALGFGSGLSPWAPGTVGTLWAWLAFLVLDRWLEDLAWAAVLAASFALGWWACTRTARAMGSADPGAIVWDEVLAFWLVLWLVTPADWRSQLAAFVLFRFFDAVKPPPVRWADRAFKPSAAAEGDPPAPPPGWRQGFGILVDDLVAALCTLLVIALWHAVLAPLLR